MASGQRPDVNDTTKGGVPFHIVWGGVDNPSTPDDSSDDNAKERPRTDKSLHYRQPQDQLDEVTWEPGEYERCTGTLQVPTSTEQVEHDQALLKWWQTEGQDDHVKLADMSAADVEDLKRLIPVNAEGELTSLGSRSHVQGLVQGTGCKPCLFVHSRTSCKKGIICPFCHLGHRRADRPRPSKRKRRQYRNLAERLQSQMLDELDNEEDQLIDGYNVQKKDGGGSEAMVSLASRQTGASSSASRQTGASSLGSTAPSSATYASYSSQASSWSYTYGASPPRSASRWPPSLSEAPMQRDFLGRQIPPQGWQAPDQVPATISPYIVSL